MRILILLASHSYTLPSLLYSHPLPYAHDRTQSINSSSSSSSSSITFAADFLRPLLAALTRFFFVGCVAWEAHSSSSDSG